MTRFDVSQHINEKVGDLIVIFPGHYKWAAMPRYELHEHLLTVQRALDVVIGDQDEQEELDPLAQLTKKVVHDHLQPGKRNNLIQRAQACRRKINDYIEELDYNKVETQPLIPSEGSVRSAEL